MPGTPCIGDLPPALPAETDRFRGAMSALPAALYTTDAKGVITYYNEAAADFWGRRPVLGDEKWCGSWRLYRTDGAAMRHDECPMAVTLKTRKPVRGAVAVLERPDGARIPFKPYPSLLFNDEGRLAGGVNLLVPFAGAETAPRPVKRELKLVDPPGGEAPVRPVADANATRADDGAGLQDIATASLFDQAARLTHRPGARIGPFGWAILRFLSRSRMKRSVPQIAADVGMDAPSAAREIASLARLGLVTRSGLGGNADMVCLTSHGRRRLVQDPLLLLARSVGRLDAASRVSLADHLIRMIDDLSAERGAQT
ncbi:MAG: hypothetical protein GC155_09115 [Alphaproteobacteria bacterium]|nr:hypothetical protein [Alphaproteobacteria bacterium]